jgi:hypothetical protein
MGIKVTNNSWFDSWVRKVNKAIRFFRALCKILNPKTWVTYVQIAEISGFDHSVSISWSQGGEDLALLTLPGMKRGRYLDIGSHHPSRFSVTRHLYQRGWSGVNIDANSALIPEFNKKRKKDINLWYAVGPEASYSLTIFKEPAISTINKDWKEKFLLENRNITSVETVPGITIREILDTYFQDEKCNLLSIDIEGADFEALKTIDFKTLDKNKYPDYILLETTPPVASALNTESVIYAKENGYAPHFILPMSTLLKKII